MEKSRENMHTDVRVKGVETLGSRRQYIRGGGEKGRIKLL